MNVNFILFHIKNINDESLQIEKCFLSMVLISSLI